jgi:hypothetical protein
LRPQREDEPGREEPQRGDARYGKPHITADRKKDHTAGWDCPKGSLDQPDRSLASEARRTCSHRLIAREIDYKSAG